MRALLVVWRALYEAVAYVARTMFPPADEPLVVRMAPRWFIYVAATTFLIYVHNARHLFMEV